MNLLKSVESTIANLLEGAFGRIFRSEVRPMELARKLAREMDEHRTQSVSRVYAPNEFAVWLSPADRARYEGVEDEVIDELCAYLLEHARREELMLASAPHISFNTDERLSLGEFGIQAQLVRHAPPGEPEERGRARETAPRARETAPRAREPADKHGETMIYSSSARVEGRLEEARSRRRAQRARLILADRRLLLPPGGATIGRSRDCDIVLDDAGISRRHAEISPDADGWAISDLGSTNGVIVNGREIEGRQALHTGDRVELGSTEILFEAG
jgi:FhaA, N-terminal domain/FHA domain